ncbi:MAG: phosphomannomutase CpsG [Pseudomonadota bacterium]
MDVLSCFKAYDIRGKLGEELNEEIAYRIGRAFAQYFKLRCVAVGSDVRLTSPSLKMALANGLMDSGADVLDIGLAGTEEIYFASFHLKVDGGVEVTASHNPLDYNGMKLVLGGGKPVSGDSGLNEIKALAEQNEFHSVEKKGIYQTISILEPYIKYLASYIDIPTQKPLKLVVNAGNGAAGHVIDALELEFKALNIPINFIKINHEPDGTFPRGIPNPILPENRQDTINAVKEHQADMGIAWDGDFDRCFLFDETGAFIEGYYIVGLLAVAFLKRFPGEKIIHDPRLVWNTIDMVENAGGKAIQSKTGHAFIKERMRLENAIYGGEMSAHHYFRDFAYCDSGMIPWLLVCGLLSITGKPLSLLVSERIAAYPISGEINLKVSNAKNSIAVVESYFKKNVQAIDLTDGLSMDMGAWRFSLRSSNTEPLLRLNVESRGNKALMEEKTAVILDLLKQEISF